MPLLNDPLELVRIFNPYGPLEDDFGKRVSYEKNGFVMTHLFIAAKNNWKSSKKYEANHYDFSKIFKEAADSFYQSAKCEK